MLDNPAIALSVVIVTYESGDVLVGCLESLPDGSEVIVVDNASRSVPVVSDARFVRAVVIKNRRNVGYGAAVNMGVEAATRPMLLLMNPDVRLAPDALHSLVRRYRASPGECVVGPSIWSPSGELVYVCRRASRVKTDVLSLLPYVGLRLPSRLRQDLPPSHEVYVAGGAVDYLQGCCILISKAAFETVGGFDPAYFLYSEEEDLCLRLRDAGIPSIYEPTARVTHYWGASTEKRREFATRHFFRSKVRLYRKHGWRGAGFAYRYGALAAVGAQLCVLPVQTPARAGARA